MLVSLLRRIRIAPRIWFLLVLALLACIASGVMAMQMLERTLLAERQESAEQIITAAHGVVDYYHQASTTGTLSRADAQDRALAALRAMRFDGEQRALHGAAMGYVWVNNLDYRMLMHPVKPDLEGEDVESLEDPEGTRLIARAVDQARADGAGTVRYLWPMPGDEEPVEKLSQVRLFEPWDWVIGSGVYLGSVRASVFEYVRSFAMEFLLLATALMAAGALVTRSITSPLKRIVRTLDRYPLEPGPALARLEASGSDELARLAQTIKHLGDVPNRQVLADRLDAQLERARALGATVPLVLFNIDRFSDVNKLLGESGADQLLERVAQRIRAALDDTAVLGRLAGDEFLVVLPGHDQESAMSVAQDALHRINQPIWVRSQEVVVTARAGIAQFPQDGERTDELFSAADQAVRRAKETGVGAELFAVELHQQLLERLELTRHLRQAIHNDELSLAWQTQVTLPGEEVRGAEALLRWTRSDGSTVSPGVFVPIAEQSSLIRPLGDWVIERVCKEASELQNQLPLHVRFALNLSPLQIHPRTCAQILEAAERHGLNPRRLEVEVTETSMSSATDDLIQLLEELSSHGIRVAVDDFGTGYSNVASIKNLPAQQLKLDRSFVASLEEDPDARRIAAAVVAMAHAMGLELLAEGIETREQAAILEDLGCDAGQGFLYSRPISAAQWLERIQDG